MATGRIDDDNIEPLLLELGDTLRRDGHGIRLRVRPEVGDLCLRRGLPRLVEGARAETCPRTLSQT